MPPAIAIEGRQIADAIEGVAPPGQHGLLIGHEDAVSQFETARESGRLHHAWLLSGPKGIGKATLAFEMAARLLGATPDPDDSVRRQIANGAHPGLIHLARAWDEKTKRFKTQLSVDDVRRTQPFFGMTAAGSRHRICIVDPADDMSIGAANALLKTLEEPPADAVFFVISHSPGRLLPTIRSRCRQLPLGPLGPDEVAAVVGGLSETTPPADILELAGGSPRQAFLASQGDAWTLFKQFRTIAGAASTESVQDWPSAHILAEKLANRNAGPDYELFQDLVAKWIADRARAGGSAPSLARWAALWEGTGERANRANTFNLDRKQVILDLFLDLFETIASAAQTDRTG